MDEQRQRLRLLGLPVFDTVEELAQLIHCDAGRLEILAMRAERFYRSYHIPKRSGGLREIRQPSRELKGIQAWILRNIIDKLEPSPYATAYLPGKSLLDNVTPHRGNRYFLSADLTDFFPSIPSWRVHHIFELIGYKSETAYLLSALCTFFQSLPQGGVTSPSLSNLVASQMDRRLSGLVSRRNIVYTRYADDLTFSANNRTVLVRSFPVIKKIVRSEGFTVNDRKTRFLGPRSQCKVTGMVKNAAEPRFGIGRSKKMEMRAIMFSLVTGRGTSGPYSSAVSIEGWLNFLKGVDQTSYGQMSSYWARLIEKHGSEHLNRDASPT